jgi:hypothetical protein
MKVSSEPMDQTAACGNVSRPTETFIEHAAVAEAGDVAVG